MKRNKKITLREAIELTKKIAKEMERRREEAYERDAKELQQFLEEEEKEKLKNE